jgi:hypothetical protein
VTRSSSATVLAACLVLVVLPVLADVPAAEIPTVEASQPGEAYAPLDRGLWGELGLGMLYPLSDRYFKTGGLDFGLGFGYWRKRLRVGGELRYTFVGGFDDPAYTYRVDFGPYVGGVLYESPRFSVVLSSRSLLSRAGTRRVKKVAEGQWRCSGDHCEEVGAMFSSIPYRAFVGLSATADLTVTISKTFLRFSYMRTRWLSHHGTEGPDHQDWLHFACGFSAR